MTIPTYKEGSFSNHEPGRPRKLLMHREQIERLPRRVGKGTDIIPLRLYFQARDRGKVELGLARGKKTVGQAARDRQRDARREADRAVHR